MCLEEITKRYKKPRKMRAYGVFAINRRAMVSGDVTDEEGIFAQYGHPYKSPYRLGKRYKAGNHDGQRRQTIGSYDFFDNKYRPEYKPGFHKYKYKKDAKNVIKYSNNFKVGIVELENVRLRGLDQNGAEVYVSDYMTITEILD